MNTIPTPRILLQGNIYPHKLTDCVKRLVSDLPAFCLRATDKDPQEPGQIGIYTKPMEILSDEQYAGYDLCVFILERELYAGRKDALVKVVNYLYAKQALDTENRFHVLLDSGTYDNPSMVAQLIITHALKNNIRRQG